MEKSMAIYDPPQPHELINYVLTRFVSKQTRIDVKSVSSQIAIIRSRNFNATKKTQKYITQLTHSTETDFTRLYSCAQHCPSAGCAW